MPQAARNGSPCYHKTFRLSSIALRSVSCVVPRSFYPPLSSRRRRLAELTSKHTVGDRVEFQTDVCLEIRDLSELPPR